MPNVTKGVVSVMIPQVWADMVLKARESRLVMAKNVMRLDSEVKSKGDTIRIPRFSNRTAKTKVADTTVAFDATTQGEFVLGVTIQAYDAVVLEDIAAVQSQYNLMSLYTQKMGFALAEKIDEDLLSVYSGHGVAQTVGATSNNTGIAKTYIVEARRFLDAADAPGNDRFMTVESYGYKQLLNIDDFIKYDARGKVDWLGQAQVGNLYGLEVLQTQNLTNNVTTSLVSGLVFQKEGIALALQRGTTMKSAYQPSKIGEEVVAYNIYGFGVPRTDHVVILRYGQV